MTHGQRTGPRPGLRERKKQRTRDALLRAALELFTTQGYERTTVDEIVEAVDVSQRTFFRYFASKEETTFAVQEMIESRFIDELRRRPAAEAPLEAMRQAMMSAWAGIGETLSEVVSIDLYIRMYQMVESTPDLFAAHLQRGVAMENQVVELIAEREGLDVRTDPRPRVAVAAFSSVIRVTGQLWGRSPDPSVESLRGLTQEYLDHLVPALASDWRRGEVA
ncbi:TetR/AcrR family transcriptional regulator [Streptomyces sp. NPDC088729]|uniref:TetR/AcrR family transcriptional regulator n=1 Tax=Streptomyces sp. NPDC088729 TaxID=3365876 RepID=UPI003812D80A